ncbi:MAG: type II toxin-antitoxin system PemK/MazF family toxin [Oceanicaulis sp.]|nr:type II toxin-antitoxin system PemK/MazF family toxin [Oceanicaulis sp.]
MSAPAVFDRGDVVWLEFDPVLGHEQGGRRPAVVMSTRQYNAASSFVLVCPVTTNGKPWPFKVPLGGDAPVEGWVLCDQIRTIDPRARHAKRTGQVGQETLLHMAQLVAAIFDLPDPASAV